MGRADGQGNMVAKRYLPERGDIVWLNFNPIRGHEQGGKRPALVISPRIYNKKTSLAVICPVTSRIKGYDFEVAFAGTLKIQGVVLSDQVRSLDWRARRAKYIEHAPDTVVSQVGELISILAQGA